VLPFLEEQGSMVDMLIGRQGQFNKVIIFIGEQLFSFSSICTLNLAHTHTLGWPNTIIHKFT